ncbi:hypothetical protein D3C73_880710 [compost metagenome]
MYLPIIIPAISFAVRVRVSQGLRETNTVAPLDLNARFRILIPEIAVTYLISGKVLCRSASISLRTSFVRAEEEPSGKVIPAKNAPPSSEGINPVGLVVNIQPVPIKIHNRMINTSGAFLIACFTPLEYLMVTFSNHTLNL